MCLPLSACKDEWTTFGVDHCLLSTFFSFILMCMSVLCICLCALHICLISWETRGAVRVFLELDLELLWAAMGVLGTELRSSGKELFFVTFEKSLQPPLRPCFETGCLDCFPSAGIG